jgi:hypothetical protein
MGDGVFARFPSEYHACKAGVAAIDWWIRSKRFGDIPKPFSNESVGLVVLVGTIHAYPFRHGLPGEYVDVSWIGADLNRFFKESKDKQFTPGNVPCVWLNETAAIRISRRVPVVTRRGRRVTKLPGIALAQIESTGKGKFHRYFGLPNEEWDRKNRS